MTQEEVSVSSVYEVDLLTIPEEDGYEVNVISFAPNSVFVQGKNGKNYLKMHVLFDKEDGTTLSFFYTENHTGGFKLALDKTKFVPGNISSDECENYVLTEAKRIIEADLEKGCFYFTPLEELDDLKREIVTRELTELKTCYREMSRKITDLYTNGSTYCKSFQAFLHSFDV
jgi:hypothetical protein